VLEEALIKSAAHDVTLRTRGVVALYILNQKRAHLHALENRFGVHITVAADDTLTGANYHALERGELASGPRVSTAPAPLRVDSLRVEPLDEEILEEEALAEEEAAAEEIREPRERRRDSREPREPREAREPTAEEGEDSAQRSRRRRRRRGRGGSGNGETIFAPGAEQPSDEGLAIMAAIEGSPAPVEGREERPPRGRGRGPGRWRRSAPLPEEFRDPSELFPLDEGAGTTASLSTQEAHLPDFGAAPVAERPAPETAPESFVPPNGSEAAAAEAGPAPVEPKRAEAAAAPEPITVAPEPSPEPEPHVTGETVVTRADPAAPKKGGWWQRRQPSGQ
jgi:ribonuclease E